MLNLPAPDAASARKPPATAIFLKNIKNCIWSARDLDKGQALTNLGVTVRQADFDKP
ncbi:hypothetical protein JJQ94_04835 [Pseudoalteromonas sp. GCY]|uniref:hypothetical protein n=1 Tax=Pseudoalteromonas sp. GCY TaxID=2003316 RepID=UPI00155461C2|nr:hypothetical protein [Pseudoalteromonas sp. GCY]QQQ65516.1 hypothetical protein JJQ94_04835 [Pseudoalteromonas sp. GCY]